MYYTPQLTFFQKALKKINIQTIVFNPFNALERQIDFGLRGFLNKQDEYKKTLSDYIENIEKNKIYRLKDEFLCCYLFMLLPDDENNTMLGIGPYTTEELTREDILEWAEKSSIELKYVNELEKYYGSIPIIAEDNPLLSLIETFAESIYGENNFSVINLNYEATESVLNLNFDAGNTDNKSTMLNMQILEARYAYENEMIQAVTRGQAHKAELMLSGFSKLSFETRLSDPVRNMKNYCIIMNTLLRKAAESGGVHPVYLDSVSSDYARKIEKLNSVYQVQGLMLEMFKIYCNLVNKHSLKNYSIPVQKAIICIESDLTEDLSLSRLSKMQNISAGYLSAIFKKETGQTLTEYVNTKRIQHAIKLLKTTNLQIQTIAQYCGILDIQYFSKMFKKHTGKTPKEFRMTK